LRPWLGPGWIYVLYIAITLILSGGAICILLFAMCGVAGTNDFSEDNRVLLGKMDQSRSRHKVCLRIGALNRLGCGLRF
jgi:hypothetical protein